MNPHGDEEASVPLKMAAMTRERTKMRPSLPRNLGTTSRLAQRMWGDTAHPNAIPPMGGTELSPQSHITPPLLPSPPVPPRLGSHPHLSARTSAAI